jgi:hypothetical protein
MPVDLRLSEAGIPAALARKLEEIAINSVRQLYARLRSDGKTLRVYLGLSDADFDEFYRGVENLISEEYPEDRLPRIHPRVNKSGVAAHRLNDPARPRYGKRRD